MTNPVTLFLILIMLVNACSNSGPIIFTKTASSKDAGDAVVQGMPPPLSTPGLPEVKEEQQVKNEPTIAVDVKQEGGTMFNTFEAIQYASSNMDLVFNFDQENSMQPERTALVNRLPAVRDRLVAGGIVAEIYATKYGDFEGANVGDKVRLVRGGGFNSDLVRLFRTVVEDQAVVLRPDAIVELIMLSNRDSPVINNTFEPPQNKTYITSVVADEQNAVNSPCRKRERSDRYIEIAQMYEGSIFDICENADVLIERMVRQTFLHFKVPYLLSSVPDPETLLVKVGDRNLDATEYILIAEAKLLFVLAPMKAEEKAVVSYIPASSP